MFFLIYFVWAHVGKIKFLAILPFFDEKAKGLNKVCGINLRMCLSICLLRENEDLSFISLASKTTQPKPSWILFLRFLIVYQSFHPLTTTGLAPLLLLSILNLNMHIRCNDVAKHYDNFEKTGNWLKRHNCADDNFLVTAWAGFNSLICNLPEKKCIWPGCNLLCLKVWKYIIKNLDKNLIGIFEYFYLIN